MIPNNMDLKTIIEKIKNSGITAYKISESVPLTEVGINKILNGSSPNPRKSTLMILENYITNHIDKGKEVTQQVLEKPVVDNYKPDYKIENKPEIENSNLLEMLNFYKEKAEFFEMKAIELEKFSKIEDKINEIHEMLIVNKTMDIIKRIEEKTKEMSKH